jgi:adenylate cyclase
MKLEIERKFLVLSKDFKNDAVQKHRIIQKYLSSEPQRTVRIRIKDDIGYLTIKGIGNETGISRYEWEREIPYDEALSLFKICEPGEIDKFRYLIRYKDHAYEVDEYIGDNSGLIIAEIELASEDEIFHKPDWLGKEVTGIKKYYNSMLMKNPYSNWK